MITEATVTAIAYVFPKEKILSALESWWASEKIDAETLGTIAPPPKKKVSILTPVIEIDSHRVVRALLEIEKIVDVEIPEKLIKPGGYESFDELVSDLIPKVESFLAKEKKDV